MRRFPTVPFILIVTAVCLTIGWRLAWHETVVHFAQVDKIKHAPSVIHASLLIHYDTPPVYEEEYRMSDVNGVSSFTYRIRSYAGKEISITAPPAAMYDVSFFFGSLVQDGVWKIVNQPPRGNTDAHYTVYVQQAIDFKQGDRTITFTDPHYWATTAGRQYSIDLRKNKPSDLLKLQSTSMADPRYEKIVDDFRTFGPRTFRHRIAAARASLGLKS